MLQAPLFFISVITGIVLILQGCSSGSSGGGTVCSTGSGPSVTISGRATFDRIHHNAGGGLDYSNITQEPVRGAVVEAVCNTVISTATTDSAGNYSLSIPGNTRNVFIRVKAQMLKSGSPGWNYSVVDNSSGQAIYTMAGALFNTDTANATRNLHAASGWTGSAYTETRVAAPFAILDSVYDATQTILAEQANAVFPALKINWNSENITGTYYDGNEIFVLGKANNDTDEYDYHVIIHEWGHYFQDKFSRDDSMGGTHGGGDILDIRVAFSEGFGNAFSAIVSNDPNYADAIGLAQDGNNSFTLDIEANNCSNSGWYSECSVQSILYDLYDSANDGSDTGQIGFGPMYDVLTGSMPNTASFTSIFSFIAPLKALPGSNLSLINALTSAQSIDNIIDEFGSGQTSNDPGTYTKLPVYATGISNVCSTAEYGGYNGLGVYRFVRITGAGTSLSIAANRTSGRLPADPDLVLYLKGQRIQLSDSTTPNSETMNTGILANGQEYILQVYEFAYTNPDYFSIVSEQACFDVSF